VSQMTYIQAVVQAVCEEMRNDSRVFVMGEDVESTFYADAVREFGPERVRNTPISEAGFIGAGVGAALTGLRPVIEAAFAPFLYSAMDQIVSQAAKSRYMFGGQASVPIVIQAFVAYGMAAAAHHSDRPWALFSQVPGLKIIVPSCPYDAKGLVKAAIRGGNPTLCFHDMGLFNHCADVPDTEYTVPLGSAAVRRRGSDLTIICLANSVNHSLEASTILEREGTSAEVVDLRCVVPLDRIAVLESVRKTGRLLVVDPAPLTCSVASEILATVADSAFASLKAPPVRLTAPDTPVPFSPALETLLYPTVDTVVSAARRICSARPHRALSVDPHRRTHADPSAMSAP
jgi:pyruvate/2-oxoglutarate/acetoin dehydrogenase E1 component